MLNEGTSNEKPNAEGTQKYAHRITLDEDQNAEHTQVTKLTAEYKQVNDNFRMLADIRFKLLALIPTLGGVAIFLLSGLQQEASEPQLGYGLLFLISLLGFSATLGVTFYDQRNSELYGDLIERARFLEKTLELPANPLLESRNLPSGGQFWERPNRGRHLFWLIRLGHDPGLALIYGAVLGAWFYPLVSAFLGGTGFYFEIRNEISLIVAFFMGVLFFLELLRLDK